MTRRKDGRHSGRPEPLPLGSVAQPAGVVTPGTEACLGCGATDLVRIRMGAPGGREVVFVSCAHCERTGWFAQDGDGAPLSSEDVTGFRAPGGPEPAR